jgi:hypothetical protein
LHLYSVAAQPEAVHDTAVDADPAHEVSAFVAADERVVGFAYDPFTDHFFLRLAPGNRMRVVDRPARKIKREFEIERATAAAGDMAVRPRDGHVFLIDGTAPELMETTRLGGFVRRISLEGITGSLVAVAIDMKSEDILVVGSDGRTVHRFDRDAQPRGRTELASQVEPGIGYDAESEELYARLADQPNTGAVFDRKGRLLRTIAITAGDSFIDVGPHSFFRMF